MTNLTYSNVVQADKLCEEYPQLISDKLAEIEQSGGLAEYAKTHYGEPKTIADIKAEFNALQQVGQTQ